TKALVLSAPTMSTFLYRSVSTKDAPISSAERNPEQAAFISKAHTLFKFSFWAIMLAVAGINTSGVEVATIIASTSATSLLQLVIHSWISITDRSDHVKQA